MSRADATATATTTTTTTMATSEGGSASGFQETCLGARLGRGVVWCTLVTSGGMGQG